MITTWAHSSTQSEGADIDLNFCFSSSGSLIAGFEGEVLMVAKDVLLSELVDKYLYYCFSQII